jgi:hypothetical protein
MRFLFRSLCKKLALFHVPAFQLFNIATRKALFARVLFPWRRIYSILVSVTGEAQAPGRQGKPEGWRAVPKRKPGRFSATKAVKANARRRIGQPKPAKVVDDAPRTGRKAKHKPNLDKLIEQGE